MLWDRGTWQPESADVDGSLQKGELKFELQGKKLQGSWVLVRTRGFGRSPHRSAWLLIKHRDRFCVRERRDARKSPGPWRAGRLLADIARDEGGDVERASKGDPAGEGRQQQRKAKVSPKRASRKKKPEVPLARKQKAV